MRLRLSLLVFPLLVFCLSLTNSAVASAASPHVFVYCFRDQCDGVWPHDTEGTGGSHCVSASGALVDLYAVSLKDKDGRVEGTLHLFESAYNIGGPNGCDTAWATVYANTTYMNEVNISTVRLHSPSGGDDNRTQTITWDWPNYSTGQWLDAAMAGMEPESPQDCIHAWAHWQDRYLTWHDANTLDFCRV
jgi:hypothetical protein